MKLTKIDRRMNGYGKFKFLVKFTTYGQGLEDFMAARTWCWDQWGPSCELVFYQSTQGIIYNPAWCWAVHEFDCKIYFTSDQEASWFILRWA
jgi:hypothetical protein